MVYFMNNYEIILSCHEREPGPINNSFGKFISKLSRCIIGVGGGDRWQGSFDFDPSLSVMVSESTKKAIY